MKTQPTAHLRLTRRQLLRASGFAVVTAALPLSASEARRREPTIRKVTYHVSYTLAHRTKINPDLPTVYHDFDEELEGLFVGIARFDPSGDPPTLSIEEPDLTEQQQGDAQRMRTYYDSKAYRDYVTSLGTSVHLPQPPPPPQVAPTLGKDRSLVFARTIETLGYPKSAPPPTFAIVPSGEVVTTTELQYFEPGSAPTFVFEPNDGGYVASSINLHVGGLASTIIENTNGDGEASADTTMSFPTGDMLFQQAGAGSHLKFPEKDIRDAFQKGRSVLEASGEFSEETERATRTVRMNLVVTFSDTATRYSGKEWCSQYQEVPDLSATSAEFKPKIQAFYDALVAAQKHKDNQSVAVRLNAVYRPPERAYLMAYSYQISEEGLDPAAVPKFDGVDIEWKHLTNGVYDRAKSIAKAREMYDGYGQPWAPKVNSEHCYHNAVDMTITWEGDLWICEKGQTTPRRISSDPKTGGMMGPKRARIPKTDPRYRGNDELHAVGQTYEVKKLKADPPHWSLNGN